MPWSAGVYTRGYPSWSTDAASNLPISATKFDTEDNDFAAGLNNTLTKDGTSGPNAPLAWALSNGQILALTRGSDGAVFSIGRTGGAHNPTFFFSIGDTAGLTISSGAGGMSILPAGNVTVVPPTSGAALQVQGTGSSSNLLLSSLTSANSIAELGITRTSSANTIQNGPAISFSDGTTNNSVTVQMGAGVFSVWNFGSGGWKSRLQITPAGNISNGVPDSGVAMTINGVSANFAARVLSGSAAGSSVTDLEVSRAGSTINTFQAGANIQLTDSSASTFSSWQHSGGQTELWQGGFQVMKVFGTRGVSIQTPSSGVALTLNGQASSNTLLVKSVTTSGVSLGVQVQAGTNQSDYSFVITNAAGTLNPLQVYGDGSIVATTSASPQGAGTINVTGGYFLNGNPIYAGIPVNAQSGATYTLVLADANKLVFNTAGSTHTYTIPSNAAVPFPVGTAVTIVNATGAGSMTINITTDTLVWAATGGTGSRALGSGGMATLVKVSGTAWYISGTQLT